MKSMSLEKEYVKVNTSFYPYANKIKQEIRDIERSMFFHDR